MIYPDPYGIFPGEYSTYCDRGFDVKIASTPRRPLYLKTCEVMQMEEMDDDVRLGAFDDNLVMFIPQGLRVSNTQLQNEPGCCLGFTSCLPGRLSNR